MSLAGSPSLWRPPSLFRLVGDSVSVRQAIKTGIAAIARDAFESSFPGSSLLDGLTRVRRSMWASESFHRVGATSPTVIIPSIAATAEGVQQLPLGAAICCAQSSAVARPRGPMSSERTDGRHRRHAGRLGHGMSIRAETVCATVGGKTHYRDDRRITDHENSPRR